MKPEELAQLTAADAAVAALELPDGTSVHFVMLTLSCRSQTAAQQLQPVSMSAQQARALALQLLDVADGASNGGRTSAVN